MWTPGQLLEFDYPTSTHVRHIETCLHRRRVVRVRRIRDLLANPLTPEEFLRRPFVARSRWLIYGIDRDRRADRKFYAGSSLQFRSPGTLRIALYDPDGTRPVDYLARAFAPTNDDRRVMVRWLIRWRNEDFNGRLLRILCDDCRVVG